MLDEVVEEAGPRLGVVVGAEVAVPDGLDQVEEHVPRVAGNAVGWGLRRLEFERTISDWMEAAEIQFDFYDKHFEMLIVYYIADRLLGDLLIGPILSASCYVIFKLKQCSEV